VRRDGVRSLVDGDVAAKFDAEGGDARVRDPAGDEAVIPVEVDVRVQGKPVHGHAARDPDADGRDLAFLAPAASRQPHAGASGDTSGFHAEIGDTADDRLLDPPDVVDDQHV